jgi:hypothetical protein
LFLGYVELCISLGLLEFKTALRRIAFVQLRLRFGDLLLPFRFGLADILGVLLHVIAFLHGSLMLLVDLLVRGLSSACS